MNLSTEYIDTIKTGLSAGGGGVPVKNPSVPSLCSVGRFEDPFNETYTIIMLNETGQRIVVGLLIVTATVSVIVLLLFAFRKLVRYTLKGKKVVTKIVQEEQFKENREDMDRVTNYPSPTSFPAISSK